MDWEIHGPWHYGIVSVQRNLKINVTTISCSSGIISLVLGIWCLFLQVIVFVYMTQTTPVIVVATIATIFAVFPMVYLLFKKTYTAC